LERNERFDIGRYELRLSGSSVGFFRRGSTTAREWDEGKMPNCSV